MVGGHRGRLMGGRRGGLPRLHLLLLTEALEGLDWTHHGLRGSRLQGHLPVHRPLRIMHLPLRAMHLLAVRLRTVHLLLGLCSQLLLIPSTLFLLWRLLELWLQLVTILLLWPGSCWLILHFRLILLLL